MVRHVFHHIAFNDKLQSHYNLFINLTKFRSLILLGT